MQPTPPPDARRPTPYAASTVPDEPDEPAPADTVVGLAHCCPHCGRPLAVLNVLVPVDEPPGDEQEPAISRG